MNLDGFGSAGFYNLAMLSLCCGIGGFASTYFLNKLGVKTCLTICAASNSIWIFSSIFAAEKQENPNPDSFTQSPAFIYTIGLLLSGINGLSFSILWVSTGKYVSDCANE
jgi:hypothetical protein